MSSNIIGPSPKKSVAPSDNLEKASGYLDYIGAPVVTIRRKDLDNNNERRIPRNMTSRGSLQYQSAGYILMISG